MSRALQTLGMPSISVTGIPFRRASAHLVQGVACRSSSSQSTHQVLVSMLPRSWKSISLAMEPSQHPPYWYPSCTCTYSSNPDVGVVDDMKNQWRKVAVWSRGVGSALLPSRIFGGATFLQIRGRDGWMGRRCWWFSKIICRGVGLRCRWSCCKQRAM